jgi:hypothetical protein
MEEDDSNNKTEAVVWLKIQVFCDIMLCQLVNGYGHCGET